MLQLQAQTRAQLACVLTTECNGASSARGGGAGGISSGPARRAPRRRRCRHTFVDPLQRHRRLLRTAVTPMASSTMLAAPRVPAPAARPQRTPSQPRGCPLHTLRSEAAWARRLRPGAFSALPPFLGDDADVLAPAHPAEAEAKPDAEAAAATAAESASEVAQLRGEVQELKQRRAGPGGPVQRALQSGGSAMLQHLLACSAWSCFLPAAGWRSCGGSWSR